MSFYGFTDTGCVRENNEDYFILEKVNDDILASVVADGMGGHKFGETASRSACEFVINAIKNASSFFEGYNDRQIQNFIKNTVVKANKYLYTMSTSNKSMIGMGTTLIVCIVYKNKYYVSNVGDSRVYFFSDSLIQITKDHSFVTELLDMGMITEQQAKVHPNKNMITRAVGTESTVLPDIYTGKFKADDYIIISTDGLTNMVNDMEIEAVIKKYITPEKITNELIKLAKTNGGTDNITVLTIKNDAAGGNE